MKKTIVNAILAATMLVSVALGQVEPTNAAAATTPAPAGGKITTPVPVMTDNLSKYGLKKDINLPVTLSSSTGLSYTLHKIMIYDFKSKDVQTLRKLYGYQSEGGVITNPKYFIWTKITIANNSKKTLSGGGGDLQKVIRLSFNDGGIVDPIGPMNSMGKFNSKEALWSYDLAPGQKLTTYFAYVYNGNFDYFVIRQFGDSFNEKYVVKE